MKCVVVLLIATVAIICGGFVSHASAYGPVYGGYGVPVQSQPLVYTSPSYHGSYVGPYAYTSPAVSHSYSHHTQTHPVAYVKPVSAFRFANCYCFRFSTKTGAKKCWLVWGKKMQFSWELLVCSDFHQNSAGFWMKMSNGTRNLEMWEFHGFALM